MFSRLEKLPQKPFARRDRNEKPNCFDKTRRRVFKHLLQFTVRLTFHYEKRVYDELLDFVSCSFWQWKSSTKRFCLFAEGKKCWKYSLPCIKMISVAAAEYPRFMDSDTNQNYFGAFNKKTFPISNQSAVNVKIIGTKATQTLRLSIVVREGKSGCGVDGKKSSSDCLTTRRRSGTEWKRGWIFFFAPLAANDNSSKTWRLERDIADFSLSPSETQFQAFGWFYEKAYSWTWVALHFNEFLTFRPLTAYAS